MDKEEQTFDEFREGKRKKKAQMTAMQNLPYEIKVKRAAIRVREFIEKCDELGFNTHVSVGGLDSITLLYFIRSLGYDIPAISVSGLEDKSIIKIHKEIGVQSLKPGKPKTEVLQEFGFPVLSKRIAGKIETLQHPTERNKTVRHAIITGECGAQGHFAKNSRMKLPQKWLELFAGYENENEGTNYKIAPFKVSNKCCLYYERKTMRPVGQGTQQQTIFGAYGFGRRTKGRCAGRTWVQLFRKKCNKKRAVCAVFATGSITTCVRSKSTSTGNIRENRKKSRRDFIHNRSTKNGVSNVRLWGTHGKTPAPLR